MGENGTLNLWRIDWREAVSAGVTSSIAQAAGVAESVVTEERERIARILHNLNVSDIFESQAVESDVETAVLDMLQDAALFGLNSLGVQWRQVGHFRQDAQSELIERILTPIEKTDINVASSEELERLPIFGILLAERTVNERETAGRFSSVEELGRRVDGIGEDSIEHLRRILSFSQVGHPELQLPSGGFAAIFGLFCNLQVLGSSPEIRFRSALRWLATYTAIPNLESTGMHERLRSHELPELCEASVVGVLWGADYYYRVPKLFEEASRSISVAMFHAAAPDGGHPTRVLLDALIASHLRGVDVKVLLDNDQSTDPYKSTVINQAACQLLASSGVAVRVDKTDELLHSKVVLIDDEMLVVGSHNWTAGSYFGFDDLSLIIVSNVVAGQMRDRFDGLWGAGSPPDE